MGIIKLLDSLTIQRIAAGEVIERPSSIIKELVENSLDANSKNITIEINQGGKSYLRVTDDGDGIIEEDIPGAFMRHSTSKLKAIEDLDSIITLGFRGEALSSVAAVAKVEMLTKTINDSAGIHAYIEEGNVKSMDKVGTPKGTTIVVSDLFYNLPVRKKFLKSDLSEGNSISNMVYKLALGNYNVSFKYIKDSKVVLNTNCNNNMKENIYTILGKDIVNGLTPVSFKSDKLRIHGFISNNTLYRSNRSHQYIYINGRYINSYPISSAIEHHYTSLIPLNRFPVFILYIDIHPSEMDVNIHPTKQEVKFVNSNDIFGIISNVVKNSLYPSLNVPKFEISKNEKPKLEIEKLYDLNDTQNIVIRDYSEMSLFSDNKLPDNNFLDTNTQLQEVHEFKNNIVISDYGFPDSSKEIEIKIEKILPEITPISVVFGTYILGENRKLDKLFIIDQHAAHERVMYEKYKKEYALEKINIQQLISPEIIELTNSEMNDLSKNLELFKQLGFELEEFGPSSYAIRGVPFLFGKPNIKNLFLDILDSLEKDIKNMYDTRVDKIMKLACSCAIKSGDKLQDIEIKSLLNNLSKCDNPYTCPHGRPTIIEITKRDIEKQFLRIM